MGKPASQLSSQPSKLVTSFFIHARCVWAFCVGASGSFWALLGLSVRRVASLKLSAFLWASLCIRMRGVPLGAQSWPANMSFLASPIISLERTVVLKRHQFSTDFCPKQHPKPPSKATTFQHVSKMPQGVMKYNFLNKNTTHKCRTCRGALRVCSAAIMRHA